MYKFTSPYFDTTTPFRWLRGNHHGHSTESDGKDEPLSIIQAYEKAGYHYLALSEHDIVLNPGQFQQYTKMCLISAVEATSRYKQSLLCLGIKNAPPVNELEPREIMNFAHKAGGLFIFDHPNWQPRPDYATDEILDTMEGMQGMEIYTGVIERMRGQALATNRWDRLLSKGWRLYGHATDDQHESADHFIAWNCVQWPFEEPPEAQGIVTALAQGRFYASTGVAIGLIAAEDKGNSIIIESDADEVHWITSDSVILKKEKSGNSTFSMDEFAGVPKRLPQHDPAKALYLRVECFGRGNKTAWTQPFWIDGGR